MPSDPGVSPFTPKAFTSLRVSGWSSLLSIWTMTYLPDMVSPGILIRYIKLTRAHKHYNPTCDDYMLPISGRPSKVAQERTTREHLAGRSRKLVWDAHVNIPGPISAAILSIKDLHPLDSDSGAIVNGKPGWTVIFWVAHVASPCICLYWGCDCVSVNTLRWLIKALKPRWHPGCYRLKQLTCKDSVTDLDEWI